MYENSKSSIDWKGLFLKLVIAFLVVLIAVTGYKTFKGDDKNNDITATKLVEKDSSITFTGNISKLKTAGEKYYKDNKDKLPKDENSTTIVTLKELIDEKLIENLTDESGKSCDIEGSYVTATVENKQTKLKANLVCGESSSYSIVYMGENDSELEKEEKTSTSSTVNKTSSSYSSSSKKQTTNTSSVKTNNGCSDCTPVVSVSTNTEVKNDITINSDKKEENNNKPNNNNVSNNNNVPNNNNENNNKPSTKYYTVTFDENGGTKYNRPQEIKEYGYARNPGENYKSGYYFIGWYLNGEKFDFNTPITRDIELVAKYSKNNSDWDDDREYDDYGTDTFTTLVYTLGWDTKGTDEISITHILRLPEDEIEDIEDEHDIEIYEIKIKDIEFYQSLTSVAQLNKYYRNHDDMFIYKANGWEKDISKMSNLATIRERDVDFDISESRHYVDIDEAEDEGFEVTWEADNVSKQCSSTFSVNGETNKCGYGIVYQVTWQYKYYR